MPVLGVWGAGVEGPQPGVYHQLVAATRQGTARAKRAPVMPVPCACKSPVIPLYIRQARAYRGSAEPGGSL